MILYRINRIICIYKFIQKAFLLFLFLVCTTAAFSQQLNIEIEYDGFFDNREYFHELSPHYSLFGNRLTGGLAATLYDSSKIHGGLSYLHEFGDLVNTFDPKYYAYYSKTGNYMDFHFGIFPRTNMSSMNRALLNDTIQYFRPFMEGMGVNFKTGNGNLEGWLDWTSRQTDTIRETFLIGISGNWSVNRFFIKHQLLALHYAHPGISTPDDHIRDNIGTTVFAGIELNNVYFMDKISFAAGALTSFDRLRGVYDWQTPFGFITTANLQYNLMTLEATYYAGQGHDLMFGDNFYKASSYARFDVHINLFNGKSTEGKIQFSLHSVGGEINYSQLFRLVVNLEPLVYDFSGN